jgi:hypothetical protein
MVWCDRVRGVIHAPEKRFLHARPDAPPTIRHQFVIGRQDARYPPLHRNRGKLRFTLRAGEIPTRPTEVRVSENLR